MRSRQQRRVTRSLGGLWHSAALALLFLLVGTVRAEPPAPLDIPQAVRQLGDASGDVRRQARKFLAAQGWNAKTALDEATHSPDPEVAQAARELLAEMLPGVASMTPPEQRELVVRVRNEQDAKERRSLIGKLMAQRPFPSVLILAVLDQESSMQNRREIVCWALNDTSRLLSALPPAEGDEACRAFVRRAVQWRVSRAIPQIVSYLFYRSRVEELRLQLEREVATSGDVFQRRLLVELDLLAGRDRESVALAIGLADQFAREERTRNEEDEESILAKELREGFPLDSVLARAGAWQELADRQIRAMGKPTGPKLFRLGMTLRLAGSDRLAAYVFALAMQAAGGPVADPAASGAQGHEGVVDDRFWLERQVSPLPGWVLVPPPELPGAMREWTVPRPDAPVAAWGLESVAVDLLQAGLVGDAVAWSERAGDLSWAAAVLEHQGRLVEAERCYRLAVSATDPPERWSVAVHHARTLRGLGNPEAERVTQDIAEHLRKGEVPGEWDLYGIILRMQEEGFGDALAEAGPEIVKRLPDDADPGLEISVALLCPMDQGLAGSWWWELCRIHPGEDAEEGARRIRQLLGGAWELDRVQALMRQTLPPESAGKERARALSQHACTWARLHRDEEADREYQEAIRLTAQVDTGEQVANCRRAYARFLAGRDRWREAAEQYQEANRGMIDAGTVDWAVARWFAGDATGCAWIMDQMGAIDPWRWPGAVGCVMRFTGRQEATCRFLPFEAWQGNPPSAHCRTGARDVVRDYALARRLAERAWFVPLKAESVSASHPALLFSGWRARIAGGASPAERDEIIALARRACEVFPRLEDEITSLARAYREAGAADQANGLVGFLLDRDEAVLDKLPLALQRLYEYAWVCVRTGQRLPEGEQRVRRALEKVPCDDELIHCLAWIRHERGDLDEAIAWGQRYWERCGSDETFYQLARWRAEKRAAAK